MIKLQVMTHNSGEYETEVESFDPVQLNEQLNNHELNTVVIGDLIMARIDVKLVSKIQQPEPEEEPVEEEPEGEPADEPEENEIIE